MSAEDRQRQILEHLSQVGEAGIAELGTRFDVSDMTIRRDVSQLAAEGLVVRTHGRVAPAARGSFEPPIALRERQNREAKLQIAHRATELVLDGQTIVLDGGSTGLLIAEALRGRHVTVLALNLRVAEILSDDASTRVMVPAGIVRPGERSISGAEVHETLERFRFDVYLMTASGIDLESGFTEWNLEDAAVKRAALRSARRTIAVCDSTKFGHVAFARVCGLHEVDALITDHGLDADLRRDVTAAVPEIVLA